MSKRKIAPQDHDKSKRLIEINYNGQALVVCVKCLRKMYEKEDRQYNKSVYPHFNRRMYPIRKIAQPASWENLCCCECGAPNNNPNFSEKRFQFGGQVE